jgi:hypothetical protein
MSDDELIARWIEPDPFKRSAAEVMLKDSGVHVWAIIGHWYGVEENAAEVARDSEIPIEAVEVALAHYRRHPELIDDRLESHARAVSGA